MYAMKMTRRAAIIKCEAANHIICTSGDSEDPPLSAGCGAHLPASSPRHLLNRGKNKIFEHTKSDIAFTKLYEYKS